MEVAGQIGFAPDAGGEIGISGGIDEDAGADGAAAGFIFDKDGGEAAVFVRRGGGGELGVKLDFEPGLAREFVQLDLEFFGVEGEADGRIRYFVAPKRAAAVEAVDHLPGQSGDDLPFALSVPKRVPHVDQRGGGDAAEAVVFFDDGDTGPEARGAHGGEKAGAAAPENTDVGLVDDRDVPRGFMQRCHARDFAGRSAACTHKKRCHFRMSPVSFPDESGL